MDVPLFMPFRKALHLAATVSEQELEANGLDIPVNKAVAKRDALIVAAAAKLEEFGITEDDLHQLVAAKLAKEFPDKDAT